MQKQYLGLEYTRWFNYTVEKYLKNFTIESHCHTFRDRGSNVHMQKIHLEILAVCTRFLYYFFFKQDKHNLDMHPWYRIFP